MPMGKGTYGSQVGRPKKKKSMVTDKQKTMAPGLKRKMLKANAKNG